MSCETPAPTTTTTTTPTARSGVEGTPRISVAPEGVGGAKLSRQGGPPVRQRFPERTLDDPAPLPARKLHGGGHWGQVDGHTRRSARRVGGKAKGGEGAARKRVRNPSWTNGTWGCTRTGLPANGPSCDLNSSFSVPESLGLTVPSMRTPWTSSVTLRCHPWRECQVPCRHHATVRDKHPPPTPAKKVRGTQQMPDVLQKCGPRPSGRKGAGHGGRPRCERKRLGVSGGSSPNNLPSLPRKRVLRAMLHCGAQGRQDTVANWSDPSKCWQEQPSTRWLRHLPE